MSDQQEYIAIGKIGAPWGLRGEVKIQLYNPQSEILRETRFVYLKAGFSFRKLGLLHFKPQGKVWVAALEGYASPESVQELRGQELFLLTGDLAPKKQGELYAHELIGMRVLDERGEEIGEVFSWSHYGSADLLNVSKPGAGAKGEILIPWIPDVVVRVDEQAKLIVVRRLEGLFD